jgi:amino acid transporter
MGFVLTMRTLRELLIGSPLPTHRLTEERLSNVRALAALSPDALASVAYANQEIFLGLAAAGAAGLIFLWPIALAISVLLAIVSLSYTQVISTYPAGGGSYTVARQNISDYAGLIAAAGLTLSYLLNVAVSMTAGVAAVTSAFPALWPYRTWLALALLAIITLANLRGLRESGAFVTGPVYLFVGTYLVMIGGGLVQLLVNGPGSFAASAPPAVEDLTPYLVLHTFAAGCTALTGIESISNGVPIFKPPESRNANRTMVAMTILMAVLFLGTVGLTQFLGVVAGPEETILSALARRVFGEIGVFYYVIQASTLLVLAVAANTSFVGFPRLASVMARDGFMPRQLTLLGDRLVFSNGITVLSAVAAALIIIFHGDTHRLIPLFAVGAFLAFTLSQAGMVAHWMKERGRLWGLKAAVNGLGMLATGTALVIIAVSRFLDGAWVVIILIPLMVMAFRRIHQHYRMVAKTLTLRGQSPDVQPMSEPRVVIPVASLHRGVILALRFASSISQDVTAVCIEVEPGQGERLRRLWDEWGLEDMAHLEIVPSPYRSVVGPLLEFLDRIDAEHEDGLLATVLIPEFITSHWWGMLLHNQTAWSIKLALLYRRRRMGKSRPIIDIPLHIED